MAETNAPESYPLSKFHYSVEWGSGKVDFSEISGLSAETEIVEYREGTNSSSATDKFAGRRKYSNVTLKRGMIEKDHDFFNWWKAGSKDGKSTRDSEKRDVKIILHDASGQPAITWSIKAAWPIKVESTDFKSQANEIAFESIELALESFTIEE